MPSPPIPIFLPWTMASTHSGLDWCRPLQILHDLETDEDVSPLAKQQCGFGACVLDGEHNLHRASCGFGARHSRRPYVCEGEFACGSAAIRTFQE